MKHQFRSFKMLGRRSVRKYGYEDSTVLYCTRTCHTVPGEGKVSPVGKLKRRACDSVYSAPLVGWAAPLLRLPVMLRGPEKDLQESRELDCPSEPSISLLLGSSGHDG